MTPTSLTLATFNVWNGLPGPHAYAAVRELLTWVRPDVLALLEGASLRHRPGLVHSLDQLGYRHVDHGGLFYRPDVLDLDDVAHPLAAAGRRVGRIPGRRSVLPDSRLTVARFTGAGGPLSVLKGHAPAHNRWGGARAAMFREWEASAADELAGEHEHHGGPALLAADFNRRLPGRRRDLPALRRAGAVTCWDGYTRPPATRRGETIDGWAKVGPACFTNAYVPRLAHDGSDHRPVVVEVMHTPPRSVKHPRPPGVSHA